MRSNSLRLTCRRGVAGVVIAAMLTASCTTTSAQQEDTTLLSDQERALRAENDRFNTSLLVGCGSGAGIALIVSGATKASASQTLVNTAIGLVGGCLAGYAAGYYLNARNANYANTQEAQRNIIKGADEDVARYAALNKSTKTLVQQQKAKVDNLNQRYSEKKLTADGYSQQMAAATKNKDLLEKKVSEANDNIKLMDQDIGQLKSAGQKTGDLEARRNKLIAQKKQLEENVVALALVYKNMPPEVQSKTGVS